MSNELNSDDSACIGSDMSLTITERNLVKRIAQLEADKVELRDGLGILLSSHRRLTMDHSLDDTKVESMAAALIQKHAAK